jgi:hypothetical protein
MEAIEANDVRPRLGLMPMTIIENRLVSVLGWWIAQRTRSEQEVISSATLSKGIVSGALCPLAHLPHQCVVFRAANIPQCYRYLASIVFQVVHIRWWYRHSRRWSCSVYTT